jgi:ankyrin repeat protein
MTLLKFLIKVGNELASQIIDDNKDSLRVMHVDQDDFGLAVRLGRVEMIAEIIKSTGFGFPLQKVFQNSGIKLDEKPKYYQGLSVHGRKRQDWAEASRGGRHFQRPESDVGVPLLAAAIEGNPDSTEFFLTDAPLRRYLEFAESVKDEKRIQALAQAKGGIKGTLNSWLSTRNQLVLHVGVLSPPRKDGSQPTFDLLLEKMPDALEVRAADGKTPLHLSFEVRRYYAAKKLIAAGANQATKDHVGRNILHTILDTIAVDKPAFLRSVISMLDQQIVAPLLLERCSTIESTGNTPLAVFLGRITSHTGWEESLSFLLSLSGGKDLEKMDGAGDYPLHNLVRRGHRELVRFIVEFRPGLLYWENATGMTVSDVVTTSFLRYQIDHPPKIAASEKRYIEERPASDFVETPRSGDDEAQDEDEDENASDRSNEWRMHRLIEALVAKYPAKRKLVGLHDANEVAKRLALQQQTQNEENRRRERLGLKAVAMGRRYRYGNGVVDMTVDAPDEVAEYLHRGKGFTKWDEMVWRKTEAGETTGSDGKDIETEYTRRGSHASV